MAKARALRDESLPTKAVLCAALVLLAVHTGVLSWRANSSTTFVGDDIIDFWRASTLPLLDFVLTPNDVHFIPLHRVVARLAYEAAPLDFRVGLAVLLSFHVATLALLYRIGTVLAPRAVAAVLTCAYGLHPCLGSLFMWWTSGLHRLGCLCFVAATLVLYLRYRRDGRRAVLFGVAACSLGAVGFYEKGLLVPLYMAGIEVSLRACAPDDRPGPGWLLAYPAVGAALGVFLVSWYGVTSSEWHALNLEPAYMLSFVVAGLRSFAPTVFGLWLEPEWRTLVPPELFWAPPVLATVALAPRTAVPWLCAVASVAANLLALGASARSQLFGAHALLLTDRYYFENTLPVVPFVAIAVAAAGRNEAVRAFVSRRFVPSCAAALAAAALLALSLQSDATFGRILASVYADAVAMRSYVSTLRSSLADVPNEDRHPLLLRNSALPPALIGIEHPANDVETLLRLLGEDVKATRRALYGVSRSGKIYRLGKR